MATLNYSGQIRVDYTQDGQDAQTVHNLLDAMLAVDAAESSVRVDAGGVRPQRDHYLVTVSLSAEGPLSDLVAVQDELANAAVSVGLEQDVETAKQSVRIS
jgi:hypothetical protein